MWHTASVTASVTVSVTVSVTASVTASVTVSVTGGGADVHRRNCGLCGHCGHQNITDSLERIY